MKFNDSFWLISKLKWNIKKSLINPSDMVREDGKGNWSSDLNILLYW